MPSAAKKPQSGNGELRRRKKPSAGDDDDEALLESSNRGSVVDSFIMLRALVWVVNSITDLVQSRKKNGAGDTEVAGKSDGGKKKDKGAEKTTNVLDKEQMKEMAMQKMKNYGLPIFLMVLGFLTCLLIICGEGFVGDNDDKPKEIKEDFYGTLGVARDADTAEVKRAYKTLARRWHPDKNPNCTTCQETFSKIAVAYETLSDDAARAAYDETGGVATAELKSPRSVPLTRDNFDQLVTFSNDVWIVQIFKPSDSHCGSFHAFWENQIQKHGHLVRFGRVDVTDDQGKWLPVKYRVLPTVLKFGRHLGSPEIFPITAMHETPQQLLKFVLQSFPNIGMPLHVDPPAVKNWAGSSTRLHKVLLAIPGKSEEERYKSHLVPRKMASRWSELFEFRTAETSRLLRLSDENLPSEIRAALPAENVSDKQAAVVFFAANGDTKPKASALIPWPTTEDDLVLHMLEFAEMAAPALTSRSADLLCRSPAIRRVYCLVLVDPPDSGMQKAMEEVKDSRTQYMKEVEEIRASGEVVSDEEDNFIAHPVRLFRRSRGLQSSISTCRAPKFSQVETALGGAQALLLDLDTNRIASLKGLTSFRGVYAQIAYEDSLTWIDEALHPYLSLPDCDESITEHFVRSLRAATILELVLQFVTLIFLAEALLKALLERSVKWGVGAGALLVLVLLRSPPFLRKASTYLPGALLAPSLLGQP